MILPDSFAGYCLTNAGFNGMSCRYIVEINPGVNSTIGVQIIDKDHWPTPEWSPSSVSSVYFVIPGSESSSLYLCVRWVDVPSHHLRCLCCYCPSQRCQPSLEAQSCTDIRTYRLFSRFPSLVQSRDLNRVRPSRVICPQHLFHCV
jgi:hypothetical protein